MNPAVYQESYQFPAGILALAVHIAFFALLYFGFSWQTQTPQTLSVALWKSLPEDAPPVPTPTPPPPAPPEVQTAAPPPPPKPDIVLPSKKTEPKKNELKKIETKPVHAVESKKPELKPQPKPQPTQPSAAEIEADRQIAAQAATVNRMVDEYVSKIQSKIRHNIVLPPDVPDEARAEFLVTVLPDGSVLPPHKGKPSGSMAYDDAVERAILKSQPLPLPPDANLARTRFRDLKLVFQPKQK